jgi:tetratricopeptide (TPR) repeat protein
MSGSSAATGPETRLQRLLGFLASDPQNLRLIADAASAAFDEGLLGETLRLLDRHAAIAPLPPALLNLKGLATLGRREFGEAGAIFAALLAGAPDDPALRFNLAWCRAMTHDYAGALALLDEAVLATAPRAAALKVQMLHQLGPLEDALACGMGLAELYPDDQVLMGALAVVAIDAEDVELAEAYARRAGEGHDGLSTLGMLQLNADQIDPALALFDRALASYGDSGRGLLGKGLALLVKGEPAAAAACLDRSAEIFGGHVGTWVASGWAHVVMGDVAGARRSFEAALALDDRFAETQGALAVLDLMEGDLAGAKRRSTVALRLDRECLSAALAKSLIAASEGHAGRAEQIREAALNAPIGPGGRTIAQTMVALGMAGPKGSGAG